MLSWECFEGEAGITLRILSDRCCIYVCLTHNLTQAASSHLAENHFWKIEAKEEITRDEQFLPYPEFW